MTAEPGPTLGGTIEGTGAWCLDDLQPPEGVSVVTMADPPRPALRDPEGRCWSSWMAMRELAGLRAQLAAGAAVYVEPETFEPEDVDRVLLPVIKDLISALVANGAQPADAAHRVARLALVLAYATERALAEPTPEPTP